MDAVELEGEDFDDKSSNLWLQAGQGEDGSDVVDMSHNAWAAYHANVHMRALAGRPLP
ncbi:MAG: hypothetical protein ACRERE_19885 [Candidatus Entotheonellia bacterium]